MKVLGFHASTHNKASAGPRGSLQTAGGWDDSTGLMGGGGGRDAEMVVGVNEPGACSGTQIHSSGTCFGCAGFYQRGEELAR